MSLRGELGIPTEPDFILDLPPGWSRKQVGSESRDAMLRTIKDVLMRQHRPDLFAELKSMLEVSFKDMERAGVVAFYVASDAGEQTLSIPASMYARIRRSEPGKNLDEFAASLIRSEGATSLLGDKSVLRFEKVKPVSVGAESLLSHQIVYLVPFPGARRRKALELVAGFVRLPNAPDDRGYVNAMRLLFDGCVASLRWQLPYGGNANS